MTIHRRQFLGHMAAGSAILTMPAFLNGCAVSPATDLTAAALFSAGVTVFIKRLTRTESPLTIMKPVVTPMGERGSLPPTRPMLVQWRRARSKRQKLRL